MMTSEETGVRISIPFSYQVAAIPFRHQLESNLSMVENTWVDIPEVDGTSLDLALVVRDAEGRDVERVYTYAGEFWVKDTRDEGDLPFVSQHLPAAGRKIPVATDSARPSRERWMNELTTAFDLLGKVGMLKTRAAGIGSYEARNWMVNGLNGPEFIEMTVESEKARNVSSSTREERLARARALAENHSIAVEGGLYHRVDEPCIVAGSGILGSGLGWVFGCPDFLTPAGITKYHGYPVSPKDFDRLHDWFDKFDRAISVAFSFEVVNELPFVVKSDRIALVSCAQRIVTDGLSNVNSTPYIGRWCEVRDCLVGLWRGNDGKLTPSEMLAREDGDFEQLAGLIEELGYYEETLKRGGANLLQGFKMWENRTVSLELARRGPQP
jgi:hypothetical protein